MQAGRMKGWAVLQRMSGNGPVYGTHYRADEGKWGRSGDGKQRKRELDLKRQETKMCRKNRRLLEPLTWLQTLVEHELFKEIAAGSAAVADTGQNLMIESATQKLPQIKAKMMKSGGEELRRDTSG